MCVPSNSNLREFFRSLKQLKKEEDGGATALSLFIFFTMLLVSGMAVDLMRFETERTAMQNTLDTAILAAANINQQADPETLVKDFFAKSGYNPDAVSVTWSEERIGAAADGSGGSVVGRVVQADLDVNVQSLFMQLIGINHLSGSSLGRAEENQETVEISLVLDMSGSMNNQGRLENLKIAAKKFVDSVIGDDTTYKNVARTSISIVPYNHGVVLPDHLLNALNTQGTVAVTPSTQYYANPAEFPGAMTSYDREPPKSRCIQFDDSQMKTTNLEMDYLDLRSITPSDELYRMGHYDYGAYTASNLLTTPADGNNRECNPSGNPIVMLETDKAVLKNAIDSLQADGNTAIETGMKWGVALLDPAMRSVVEDLVNTGVLSEDVRNRPSNYHDANTKKFVVVMTDGENTSQYDLQERFRVGPSPVWFSPSTAGMAFDSDVGEPGSSYWNGFFIQLDDSGQGYWFQGKNPRNYADGQYHARANLPADAYQLSYPTLYERFSEFAVAELFSHNSTAPDARLQNLRYAHINAEVIKRQYAGLDSRLTGQADGSEYGICDAATHNNDITVFSIAFTAPAGGAYQMLECATSESFYFDAANGADLDAAFQSIAGQINSLRLTQ